MTPPPPPKVVVDNFETQFTLKHPDRVSIGREATLTTKETMKKVGQKLTLTQVLNIDLGEEVTHYLSFHQVPENWENARRFKYPGLGGDYENFLNYVSILFQLEGIGKIGNRVIARKLNVFDYEMEKRQLEFECKVNDQDFKKCLSPEMFEVQRKLESYDREEADEMGNLMVKTLNRHIVGLNSAIGVIVADELEKEYRGKFPKLIRKTLKPEERYKRKYHTLAGVYYPNLKTFLDGYFKYCSEK